MSYHRDAAAGGVPRAAAAPVEHHRSRYNYSILVARLFVASALLIGVTVAAGAGAAETEAPAARSKPNILMILTDDQAVSLVDTMDTLKAEVVQKGATFTHAYYNDPLCCPSRATMLTGKYGQNTKVSSNHRQWFAAGDYKSTVATVLHDGGYRTGLIGKYLNGYPAPEPKTYIPPGWDYWQVHNGGMGHYYDYTLNENGKLVSYGHDPQDYSVTVFTKKAASFVKQAADDKVPFFLEVSVHPPHTPSTPAPGDEDLFPGLQVPRTPSFDEVDVSDKPAFVRGKAHFGREFEKTLDSRYRGMAQTLHSVDEMIKTLTQTLRKAGQLDNTYIVFVSDNGWLSGQHRFGGGKGLPYEEVLRLPLYVRGRGVTAGATLDHLVGNADLAPTFAAWAGLPPPAGCDGRSFARLLKNGAPAPEAWRQAYPLVFSASNDSEGEHWPNWRGVRTPRYTYAEYADGERELYDNDADPYQLENLASSDADKQLLGRLSKLSKALSACKGAACRKLEDAGS